MEGFDSALIIIPNEDKIINSPAYKVNMNLLKTIHFMSKI